MAGAYNLYVNLMATTGGLSGGLRSGAAQLRAFDGQLDSTAGRLGRVQAATRDLARTQAAASAQVASAQGRAAQAGQRAAAAQQAMLRAQAVEARSAARAEAARAAEVAAGARASRAQAAAQQFASRAAAAVGRDAERAARTAAGAQAAAARATDEHAQAQQRAAAAQQTATRATTAMATAERRAQAATATHDEARQRAARTATAAARQTARAEAALAAARNESAASSAQAGLAIGAALGVGVAQAIALEKAMANVMTISQQITHENVSQFTDQIVKLSTQLPQTATELADGLYQVVSTGFDGAEAMQILDVAARGASAGLTTSETSARALLGVLKAYGMEAGEAGDVMDVMFQTVNLGVISFEELAQQLGDVVPMAAAAGVEFDDMSAALAAITLSGIPAAEAVTALNMLLTRVMKPTQELRQAMKDLGYESAASAVEQDGLYVVVNKLNNVTGGTAEGIANMWKDIRATRAALALAAADGRNYADSYAGIASEIERAEATQKAYAIQTDTVSGQWKLFANQARALGIDVGRALLPALEAVGTVLHTVVGAVNELPAPMKAGLGIILATAAGLLLLRGAYTKVTGQIAAFRAAQAAASTGGGVMPAVLAGAGLAVSGLAAVLTLGIAGYAAYTASKTRAKDATEELVKALREEREEGKTGVGMRELLGQLTDDGALDDLKKVGIGTTEAIDAITSGGAKLATLKTRLDRDAFDFNRSVRAGDASGSDLRKFSDAKKVLDERHKIWSDAVKKSAELAEQQSLLEARIKQHAKSTGGLFDLFSMADVDRTGGTKVTDEMKSLAKAVGDAVDPSRAFRDAQTAAGEAMKKAGRDAADARVSLAGYMDELRKQLAAQRDFQRNLSELAVQGYADLGDHFAELGVDAAPMLDDLVKQLRTGKTKVADELRNIVTEDAERSTEAYRLGLEKTAQIAEQYGPKIARAWARASERNDPVQFKKVTEQMAMLDLRSAVKASVGDAQDEFDRGLGLLAQIAKRKGATASAAFQDALLQGDVERAMDSLKSVFGAKVPISAPDLSKVVAAFRSAGDDAHATWSGALELIRQVAATKGTQAASALTAALLSGDMAAVKAQLDSIGMSVTNIPGSKNIAISVSAPPSVNIPVYFAYKNSPYSAKGKHGPYADGYQGLADGAVVDYFAQGGVRQPERHVAQIARAGSWRVWAEESTGGEAFIPLAHNKRTRSRAIAEETVRRLGGRGIDWYADGGMTDWSYSPTSPSELRSVSTVRSNSMRKVKRGKKTEEVFDLALFEKNLAKAARAAGAWRKNLSTVARRAGQEVADALEAMGEDGVELTKKMANGSGKYIKEMTAQLTKLGLVAKATLSDYTAQLKAATGEQNTFEKDLAKLAAMGYGSLAARLAEQGDAEAHDIARQAAGSKKKAAAADKASKAADQTVPADDLADLLRIIGAIKSKTTGIHAVAATLEMDEDEIIRIANVGRSRISTALGSKATKFLTDLSRANKELAYAQGGILTPGIYATSNGIVRFAEPSTQGEAFIPLGAGVRSTATTVLADVASRFGYQLTKSDTGGAVRLVDAHPQGRVQVVVIREQPAALVGSMPVTVSGGDRTTADEVGAAVMRRLRAAQRGGRI
ncbi:phage tail tape measure protein [Streptomyces albidoflavus]|uniref:phage tail tape measure protein n=1 Tax=Streptomyces albidoflavus TaxID=1886 RepID=UPI0033D1A725